MKNLIKILIVLLLLGGAAFFYYLGKGDLKKEISSVQIAREANNKQEKLVNDYKSGLKSALNGYNPDSSNLDQVTNIKNRILNLTVPTQFKDLHLNLVFAFVKMEDYFKTGNQDEKVASEKMLNEARQSYSWLN